MKHVTGDKRAAITAHLKADELTQKEIADKFNIAQSTVHYIKKEMLGQHVSRYLKSAKRKEVEDITDEEAATIMTAADFNDPPDARSMNIEVENAICRSSAVWESILCSPKLGCIAPSMPNA